MKKTFSTSEAISFGWKTFRSNWKFWIVASLIVGMTTGASGLSSVGNINKSGSLQTPSVTKKVDQDLQYPQYQFMHDGETDMNQERLNKEPLSEDYKKVLGVSTATEKLPISDKGRPSNLILLLIPFGIIALVGFLAVGVIGVLVSIVLRMGYLNLTLDAARNKNVYYKTILNQVSLKKAWRYLKAHALVFLMVFLGCLFFIFPGIILALKYSMVPFVLVDLDKTPSEAMKMSQKLTKGVRLKLLGFWFVSGLVMILGILAFGVGVLPASIVVSLAYAYVYNKLLEQSEPEVVPGSSEMPPVPAIEVPIPSSDEVPSMNSGNLLAEN